MAPLGARVVVVVLSIAMASGVPGTFFSNSDMDHRRLPNPLSNGVKTPIASQPDCESLCSKHAVCDAYAYSSFHKTCMMYQVKAGERAIIQNMYKLYIREKGEYITEKGEYITEKGSNEGYLKHGTDYIKFNFKMMNTMQAKAACAEEGGRLVSIKSEEMNNKLKDEMGRRTVSAAFIGLTDEIEEENWIHADGTPLGEYDNWDWNGVWRRTDLNCAIIGLDGTWSHTNCNFKFYSICQIPMF
ncbi:C-type lectin-like [Trinorchestia longiramus]|nr:C-type lectin-like [Trinorchestia longiramus]